MFTVGLLLLSFLQNIEMLVIFSRADSLELLESGVEEVLEVLVLPELAELLTVQDPLRAGQVGGDVGPCSTNIRHLSSLSVSCYLA